MLIDTRLSEVDHRICDLASDYLGIPRHRISPECSLVEDLGVDSLDLIELFSLNVTVDREVMLPHQNRRCR